MRLIFSISVSAFLSAGGFALNGAARAKLGPAVFMSTSAAGEATTGVIVPGCERTDPDETTAAALPAADLSVALTLPFMNAVFLSASAASEAAALGNAGDDFLHCNNLEPSGSEVIEKEKGFCALDDEIVGAHGDEVDPYRVVAANCASD